MGFKKLAFFGLSISALTLAASAFAAPGFLPIENGKAPAPVLEAAKRALEVWAPAGSYSEHGKSEYSRLEADLKARGPAPVRDTMHARMNLAELRMCRSRGASACLLSSNVARGTGFVVHGSTFVTVRHTFSSLAESGRAGESDGISAKLKAMSAMYARQLYSDSERAEGTQSLQNFAVNPLHDSVFLLTNSENKTVFDSSRMNFQFIRYGALTTLRGDFNSSVSEGLNLRIQGDDAAAEAVRFTNAAWILDDQVWIDLKIALPSLNIARSGCEAGRDAYNIGYPTKTSTRAAIEVSDAVDMQLAVTHGKHLSIENALLLGRGWSQNALFLNSLRGKAALLNDADSSSGMSGGMMVNEAGEVCAILKGSFDSGLGAYPMYTVGVRLAPGGLD